MHFKKLIAAAPRGEYHLYTDMPKALNGIEVSAAATVTAQGAGSLAIENAECGDEAKSTIVEMAQRRDSHMNYLDYLANVASQESHSVALSGGRTELTVSASADAQVLSVARLVINVSCDSEAVVRIDAKSAALVQIKVNVDDNAKLKMVLMQEASSTGNLLTRTSIDLSANSEADLTLVNIHPKMTRNEVRASLNAEGAQLRMGGLYSVADGEFVDNETTVEHMVGKTSSDQLFKGIADGKGVMAFGGLILVKPDAQKTTACQTNRHMLGSREARAYAKPQLEIYADDVKCSHGATTGQVNAAQLFYMQQRGIDEATARRLLAAAFVGEVADRIPMDDVRESVKAALTGIAD